MWGADRDVDPNVVEVYVGYLRRKIGVERIQTVRGAIAMTVGAVRRLPPSVAVRRPAGTERGAPVTVACASRSSPSSSRPSPSPSAAGAWSRSVERTQLGRIAAATEDRLDAIAAQLEEGVDPNAVQLPEPAFGPAFVQVIGRDGDVLTALTGGRSRHRCSSSAGTTVLAAVGRRAGRGRHRQGRRRHVRGGRSPAASTASIRYERVGDVTASSPRSPLQEVHAFARRRAALALGRAALLVALVGLAAWFVTGRALQPVEAMRREVEAIIGIDAAPPRPRAGRSTTRSAGSPGR